ncbi:MULTISPECIES: hypothetical protein [Peribacillus]|uniref:hypothetical protein n=1 Tax=Peribacillus TaxID=2675229 RepID=UPI00203E40F8|nr:MULTISPECIES: hypothetical protein [Peribacillus]MCM3674187.1 hypothetical protein [Peribacillus simplex]MDQ0879853.1 hypothetical protein [Peribacillus sp. V2I11]
MKPHDSFNQKNRNNNGTENNLYQHAYHPNMKNDFPAAPYPFENQQMDERTPPGPPGPSF